MLTVEEGRKLLLVCLSKYTNSEVTERMLGIDLLSEVFRDCDNPNMLFDFAIAYNVSEGVAEEMSQRLFRMWSNIKDTSGFLDGLDLNEQASDLFAYCSFMTGKELNSDNIIEELMKVPNMPQSYEADIREALTRPYLTANLILKLDVIVWLNE